MKDTLKKTGTWLFFGPALNKSFNINNILEIATVNIIAVFGIFYFFLALFLDVFFLHETYPSYYHVITYVLIFILVLVFVATHTNKGIERFNIVKTVVILSIMLFYGFVYTKITYGNIWSFLIPIMVIFLTDIYIGLILCTCYFILMLTIEFIFRTPPWDLFYRQVCVYWSLVIMVGVYEALRMWYNKRMQEDREKIEILSLTDHLTKLYNRRYFSNIIGKEFARAIRQKECLSFLMIDADKFKDYNDTFGHLQGDEQLILLAEVFKRVVRRSEDLVFRLGGEEFGILLPNTEFKGAFSIAEKLKKEVENSTKITISVGLASVYPKVGETSEALLKLADSNLYKAKETGRNKVVG